MPQSSPHPHGNVDYEREYKVKSIVGETKTHYLIAWEPDEETGEHYKDTKEPKRNVNQAAIDDWKRQKSATGISLWSRSYLLVMLTYYAGKQRLGVARLKDERDTPRSASPKEPASPGRRRGRPRKVVESSPPPEDPSQIDGRHQAEQIVDDLLEIGESQQSNAGATQEDPASPLFVPQDTQPPSPEPLPGTVQISDPPSSYLAGAYERASSSQATPSTAPTLAVPPVPEPSQYVPDLADSSKTTEDTTRVTHPSTTPSGSHSAPGDLVQSPSKFVPDSQSLLGSSSYKPSASTTKSLTAPNLGEQADSSSGEPATAAETQSEQVTLNISASGASRAERELREELHNSDAGAVKAADVTVLAGSDGLQDQQTRISSGEDVSDQHESTHLPSRGPNSVAEGAEHTPIPQQGTSTGQESSTTHPVVLGLAPQEHTEKQPSKEQQPSSPQAPAPAPQSQTPPPEHIDLTAITEDFPVSQFTVTPPTRRKIHAPHRNAAPAASVSSVWHSSFPFQTQVSRPASAGSALPFSGSQRPGLSSQQFPRTDNTRLRQLSTNAFRSSSVPLPHISPSRKSSLIGPPARSIDTGIFSDSTPPRPRTPSSPVRASSVLSSMEPSQPSPGTEGLYQRLKAMREASNRKREIQRGKLPTSEPAASDEARDVAQTTEPQSSVPSRLASEFPSAVPPRLASPLLPSRDNPRSPSAVPHLEPLPSITLEEMNTSKRFETLLPQSRDFEGAQRQHDGSLTTAADLARKRPGQTRKDHYPETASAHEVPIFLFGHQRDDYPATVFYNEELIRRFLATSSPDQELLADAKRFIERMRHVTLHPDLINAETLTQHDDVQPSQQASWDVSCSAKFCFLKELLDCLREDTLRIAIVARQGRILDILETFLQGIRVSCQRLDTGQNSHPLGDPGTLRVILLAADEDTVETEPCDLIVAMDNSMKYDAPQIQALRRDGEKWAPFISLVVPCTVEHIEQYLSPSLSEKAWCHALVSGIVQFKSEAGKRRDGQQSATEAAKEVAKYLTSIDAHLDWPLASLSTLANLDSQTESEVEHTADNEQATDSTSASVKRSRELDGMEDHPSAKRPRSEITPNTPSTINPRDIEITHISDSVDKTTQSNETETDKETDPLGLSAIEKRLQELLHATRDRLEEHVQALSQLQYRHEEQRSKLIEVTAERDAAIATAQNAIARYTEQSNSTSNLKTQRTEVQEHLKIANARLLDHTVPERAEFERLRLDAESSSIDKERLDDRLKKTNDQLEYVRGIYQTTSNQAAKLAGEVADLTNQLAIAQNKATGEQAKLRGMGYDAFTKNLQNENRKLKAMLKDREAGLKFRDGEIAKLKEASRGRMGTRGTSVPRSPRLGSPAKMATKMGSRQASPAIGEARRNELLHPLRNT